MTNLHKFDAALRNVQSLPLQFDRIPDPVKLDDTLWPPCKTCGGTVNECWCAEYRP